MRKYCTIQASVPGVIDGPVDVYEWTAADPFPSLGSSVGVDTETELITDSCLFPPLVVLGVYDGEHKNCYIVTHEHAPAFMHELCARDIQQRYFNLGFDEGVLDNEDPDKALMQAIDSGRVVDMQIREHLFQIASEGFVYKLTSSLAGSCAKYLKLHLDKGDGTENSARLSFHRGVPITEEQARYLPMDCITTWALGEVVPSQKVEVAHTKGMCVLAHISANGFLVDQDVFQHYERKLMQQRAEQREILVDYGFPDPDGKALDMAAIEAGLTAALRRFSGCGDELELKLPGKQAMRLMLTYMWNHDQEPAEVEQMRHDVLAVSFATRNPSKVESALYDELLEGPTAAWEASKKKAVMPTYVTYVLEELAAQAEAGLEAGYDVGAAIEAAATRMDAHKAWLTNDKPVGPKKFFQDHVTALIMEEFEGGKAAAEAWLKQWEADNPKATPAARIQELMRHSRLKLATTKKSGEIQLTMKDKWRLADLGIRDGFLEAYTTYGHANKYLSTYLNASYVKSDGRVHPRFVSVLRTGRTSYGACA